MRLMVSVTGLWLLSRFLGLMNDWFPLNPV